MRRPAVLAGVLAVVLLAGCGSIEEKQWMKVGEKYTTAEFRNDMRDCAKSGKVDEDCMRARGWVSVNPGRATDTKPVPQTPLRTPVPQGRY